MLLKSGWKGMGGAAGAERRSEGPGGTATPLPQSTLWCHCYHQCPDNAVNNTCPCLCVRLRTDGYCFTMVEEEGGVEVHTAGCIAWLAPSSNAGSIESKPHINPFADISGRGVTHCATVSTWNRMRTYIPPWRVPEGSHSSTPQAWAPGRAQGSPAGAAHHSQADPDDEQVGKGRYVWMGRCGARERVAVKVFFTTRRRAGSGRTEEIYQTSS
ncbi:unnamed protein product [Arctogadus glacialis]